MSNLQGKSKNPFSAGICRGWRSFFWIIRIVIPVSLLTTILQWSGWFGEIEFLLKPLTAAINLPPEAVLPIISGMFVNLYAAIAAMAAIPFTADQLTLIAVFSLICHNLIAEGIIQHKSGLNIIKASLIRFGAAVVTVIIVSQFFSGTSQSVILSESTVTNIPILELLKDWSLDTLFLLMKILGIIMGIMIILEFSESKRWSEYYLILFRPLMKVLRLSERTTLLWMTSIAFGLSYCGAIVVDEAKKGVLTKEELESLHISVGINHGMVEDPALFMVMGLNPFWLFVPKLAMAIIAVQVYRALRYLKSRLRYNS